MLAAVEGTGVVEINVTTGERKVLVPHPSYVIGLAHAACGKIAVELRHFLLLKLYVCDFVQMDWTSVWKRWSFLVGQSFPA